MPSPDHDAADATCTRAELSTTPPPPLKIICLPIPTRSILKTPDTSHDSHSSRPREVSFAQVQIREYAMELGNNPACTIGAPVELSWTFDEESTHDIDVYECERRPRRKINHLILNYYRRQDILRKAGYSEQELKKAERAVNKARRQRFATAVLLPISKLEEVAQSARRKVHRVVNKN